MFFRRWKKVTELSVLPKKMSPKTIRKWFEQIENDKRYRDFVAKLGKDGEEEFRDIMAFIDLFLWKLERRSDLRYLMIDYASTWQMVYEFCEHYAMVTNSETPIKLEIELWALTQCAVFTHLPAIAAD